MTPSYQFPPKWRGFRFLPLGKKQAERVSLVLPFPLCPVFLQLKKDAHTKRKEMTM